MRYRYADILAVVTGLAMVALAVATAVMRGL